MWGPFAWNNGHLAMAAAVLTRGGAIYWLVGMPDPGSAPVWSVLRRMGANVYDSAVTGLFYPLRIFGWLRPAADLSHQNHPRRK